MKRNGTSVPRGSYTPNLTNGQYWQTYSTFLQKLECDTGDKSICLTPSEWANGCTLYAFKITDCPIRSGTYGPRSKSTTGSARLDVWFAAPVNENIKVIVFYQMPGRIEFDQFKCFCPVNGFGELNAREIDCLVLRLLIGVCWLGVFARDELPELSCKIRPWCHILNTDFKNQPGTHWLAHYAPIAGGIEPFYSFGLSLSIYSLEFVRSFHLLFSLKSPSSSVCGHYCIVYIYLRSRNNSLSDIVNLLIKISSRDLWVKQYIHNLQILLPIINLCHRNGHRCKFKCLFVK